MDPWTVGLAFLVILGLAVVVYGAMADRAKNRRAAREMLSPPPRDIPRFRPDAPAPHYLSELQARRPPADAKPVALSPGERESLRSQLETAAAVSAGFASCDFVTDPASAWAVLDNPVVLVCAEPVTTLRELLPVLERLLVARHPLVLVAPGLAPEVLKTLEVNVIQQTMQVLAVTVADADDRRGIAEATGAEPTSRADLQSGYLAATTLGRCGRWVSTAERSYLLQTSDATGPAS